MKQHKCLLMTAIVIAAEIIIANVPTVAQQKAFDTTANKSRFTTVVHSGDEPLEQAYQDVIIILSNNNPCNRFFGDAGTIGEVLSRLVARFELHPLNNSRTGIHMSGSFTYFEQEGRDSGFRLFATATINTRGPFFKTKAFPTEPHLSPVGSFLPNTREALVLMLLYELAHLVKGPDGNWLIADDGDIPELSARNTDVKAQGQPVA